MHAALLLFSQAIDAVLAYRRSQGTTVRRTRVYEEIADEVGLTAGAVRRWQDRRPVPASRVIPLAHYLRQNSTLDQDWFADFFAALQYEDRNQLLAQLFPRQTLLLPHNTARIFGRDDVIEECVNHILRTRGGIMLLWGPGGIGKTTTVVNAATRAYNAPDSLVYDVIYWSYQGRRDAESDAPDIFLRIAQLFYQRGDASWETFFAGRQEKLLRQKVVANLSRQLTAAREKYRRIQEYLIIVDDVETGDEVAAVMAYTQPLLEACDCKLWIVSQAAPSAAQVDFDYVKQLPALDESSTYDLLRHRARSMGCRELALAPESELHLVYEATQGHPWALQIMVHLVMAHSLADALSYLQTESGQAVKAMYAHIFESFWRTLPALDKQLLFVICMGASESIARTALMNMLPHEQEALSDAVQRLRSLSLLQVWSPSLHDRRYGLHQLTRYYVTNRIDGAVIATLTPGMFDFWRARNDETRAAEQENLRHFLAIALDRQETRAQCVAFLLDLFPDLQHWGYWPHWLALWQKATRSREYIDDKTRHLLLRQQGRLHRYSGQYNQAMAIHQEALILSSSDKQAAICGYELMENERARGRYADAYAQGQQTLAKFRELEPAEPAWMAAVLNSLGIVARRLGWLDVATVYLEEAVEIWTTMGNLVERVHSLINLGNTMVQRQAFAQAETHLLQAEQIQNATSLPKQLIIVYNSLGTLYFYWGCVVDKAAHFDEAEKYFRLASRLCGEDERFGDYAGITRYNLGNLLTERTRAHMGAPGLQLVEAEELLRQSIDIYRTQNNILGEARSLLVLGEVHELRGRIDEARQTYKKTIADLDEYVSQMGRTKQTDDLLTQLQTHLQGVSPC